MLELKQELEALADRWHNYIGGGTMTNKEHAARLREIIAKHDHDFKRHAVNERVFQCIRDLFAQDSKEFLEYARKDARNKVSA
jgi:hypothetical protein